MNEDILYSYRDDDSIPDGPLGDKIKQEVAKLETLKPSMENKKQLRENPNQQKITINPSVMEKALDAVNQMQLQEQIKLRNKERFKKIVLSILVIITVIVVIKSIS